MTNQLLIREYKNTDKEAVLNLFHLNTPEYFSTAEESELVHYLKNEIEYYFVLELNEQIIGSGGINFSADKTIGIISWDMIQPDFQGKSYGSKLLNYRIEKLKEFKEVKQIIVRTSQLAYKFYEKNGFRLFEIIENYWAKGFHFTKWNIQIRYTKMIDR